MRNMGRPRRLLGCRKKSFSEMESEEPCDYNDHYDYADDVENIHRSAPIEECTICARPVLVHSVTSGERGRLSLFSVED
jgi:hypothetical protein